MIPQSFRIAMLNTLRIGPYDTPYRTNAPLREWLIAARSGPTGEHLIISDTATSVDSEDIRAPDDLSEQNSIVAILAELHDSAPQFLMLRHLPDGVSVPGRFFPADGVAVLSLDGAALGLNAFGRHAHSRGTVDGRIVLHDIPHPAPDAEGAINWHFAALEHPWSAAMK
ncbi:hypothetical protein [Paracoccus sp. AK26]|uniref:hypothetical protein n=1 Tax=Paracoccus sp. AK26 TaxID=2589076 RepID=UPI001428840F|nr:hypothetical protein [Paracoccus sp. AK26]QIR86486.1 hypothetical protein FIU66_14300 [Paracoccus sp. AK26]